MNGFPTLTFMTALPAVAGIVLLCLRGRTTVARSISMAVALAELLLAVILWMQLPRDGMLHFVERYSWVPSLGVEYFLGLDGIGLLFVLLATLVLPMALLVSRNSEHESHTYYGLLLLLQAGLIGTFTALNFVHWFFFWELSLIPAFFLVKTAGSPIRGPAATQFFVYTMVGSIAMLVGFLGLYFATGTFDFFALATLRSNGTLNESLNKAGGLAPGTFGMLLFWLVFLGLAVKLPLVPFHSWLPPAYTEAASPVTMMLTGVMSKMGVYGLIRVLMPIFTNQIIAVQDILMTFAVVTILYSAFAALAQTDLKRIFAYSSINHLGYCALGVFAGAKMTNASAEIASALNGVLLQVLSHGILAASLFAFAEFLARRNNGSRDLNSFGGLRKIAPATAGLMGIAIFASLGLPGLSGFVAEFLIFRGAFAFHPWASAFSVIGLLLTALFLLLVVDKVFYGPLNPKLAGVSDMFTLEKIIIIPALVLSFLIGVYPAIVGVFINPAVQRITQQLQP